MICKSFGNNTIFQFTNSLCVLQRKNLLIGKFDGWAEWNGDQWGSLHSDYNDSFKIDSLNFTDYDVPAGLYLYRVTQDGINFLTSPVVKVGSGKIGWTFGNYESGDDWGEILTPDDLRFTYMWGVDFRASNGDIFTDEQIRFCINSALQEIERTLNYDITKKIIKCNPSDDDKYNIEEAGYSMRRGSNQIVLRHVPVLSIERFDLHSYFDNKIIDLKDNMILDKSKGVLEFRPLHGNMVFQSAMTGGYGGGGAYSRSSYRNAFKIDYTVGLKNTSHVPEDVRDVIGKIAVLKILNIVGDGLIAGFSSSSLSMDGVSESFSSTQSATSAYFGARIKVYEDNVQEWKKANLRKFKRLCIGVI